MGQGVAESKEKFGITALRGGAEHLGGESRGVGFQRNGEGSHEGPAAVSGREVAVQKKIEPR